MIRLCRFIAAAAALATGDARAGESALDDLFAGYFQRTEGVTLGAGDAKQANAAAQIIDPWPRNVRNRYIPANGQRMVGGIQRYQDTKKLRETPPSLAPEAISSSGFSGGSAPR